MRILILTQVYWPDTAATAQHLADLGAELASRGHEVEVVCVRRSYEDPAVQYPAEEVHAGVKIRRLWSTGLGKASVWRRLVDFASCNLAMAWRVMWMPRDAAEVMLGMTSPPLISWVGSLVARWKGWRFCHWGMDLQPELAIEAGMIRKGSVPARVLEGLANAIFRRSDRIVALDRFMAGHMSSRGARPGAVAVLPVWPVMTEPWRGERLANPFRLAQGFGDRIVVMYSGNHAVVHPLDTLLEAILTLRDDPRFLFVFIGGGVRTKDVRVFRDRHGLENVVQLPFQPRERIHESLAAADLHVVVMGDGQVGYTHPNKVYGAMYVGRPFLYIGPEPSHVSELLDRCAGNYGVRHGDPAGVVAALQAFADAGWESADRVGAENARYAQDNFHPRALIPKMAELVAGTPRL